MSTNKVYGDNPNKLSIIEKKASLLIADVGLTNLEIDSSFFLLNLPPVIFIIIYN